MVRRACQSGLILKNQPGIHHIADVESMHDLGLDPAFTIARYYTLAHHVAD